MNIAVTIFYAIGGAWLIALLVVVIIKKSKQKKAIKLAKKEAEENANVEKGE